MDKKRITKFIIALMLFMMGSLVSIYLSVYIDLFLRKGIDGLKLIGILDGILILIENKKARNLFFIFELGTVLLSIFYFLMKDTFYESELIEITPNIKIPAPAGQMQFGSARFATDSEKETLFEICELKRDKRIKDLIEWGSQNIISKNHLSKDVGKVEAVEELDEEVVENKYYIEEEIEKLFKDNLEKLSYFKTEIKKIDEIIFREKNKEYEKIEDKIKTIQNKTDREKLKNQLEEYKKNNSQDLEVEIMKLKDDKMRLKLSKIYDELLSKIEEEENKYVKEINKSIDEINITEKTDLEQQYEKAKEIEEKIERLRDIEKRETLFHKLVSIFVSIDVENERRYKEVEEMLNGGGEN